MKSKNTYERKYLTWREGIIHLIIGIILPLVPVVVYVMNGGYASTYYYILLLTVIVTFLYEFLRSYNSCTKILKIENFITTVIMVVMAVWDFILLVQVAEKSSVSTQGVMPNLMDKSDFVLASLFLEPIIVTIVEVLRAFVFECRQDALEPSEENIVDGAGKV